MFTGIVTAIGAIKKTERKNTSLLLSVQLPAKWKIKAGDSVAVNGACLTAKKVLKGVALFELMPETLSKTSFGKRLPNSVNLEQPLKVGNELGGHFLQGHIDTTGIIQQVKNMGDPRLFTIGFSKRYSNLIVQKGSIAVDGISLTVVEAEERWFSVSLASYTLEHTTLNKKHVGDIVNLEFDVLGKYVNKMLARGK